MLNPTKKLDNFEADPDGRFYSGQLILLNEVVLNGPTRSIYKGNGEFIPLSMEHGTSVKYAVALLHDMKLVGIRARTLRTHKLANIVEVKVHFKEQNHIFYCFDVELGSFFQPMSEDQIGMIKIND